MISQKKIWSSVDLPTLPTVTSELLRLSRDPDCEMREFNDVLRSDVAISARVLRAVNSPLFGGSAKIDSVEQAIPRLGTMAVTSLALSCSLIDTQGDDADLREHYRTLWKQSLVQAVTADIFGKRMGWLGQGDLFLVGLLLDVGRLAMLRTIPDEYSQVLSKASDSQIGLWELEQEILGFNHAEVGKELVEKWNLPEVISDAVGSHHLPLSEIPKFGNGRLQKVQASVLASAVGEYFTLNSSAECLQLVRTICDEFMQLNEEEVEQFLSETRENVSVAGDILSIDTNSIPSPAELIAQANHQLADIAIRQQIAVSEVTQENNDLLQQKQTLEQQAVRDRLTGTYNRHYFDNAFEQEIARCQRNRTGLGVLFMDIDKFKSINDTHGHACGDHVLEEVAHCLQDAIRKSDTLARVGGEEFVVLSLEVDLESLSTVAERLRSQIEKLHVEFEGKSIPVTISIGGAIGVPDSESAQFGKNLIGDADEAMYLCKRNGRNRTLVRPIQRPTSDAPSCSELAENHE